jgi:Domain of unknown function (DUF4266)
MSNPLFAEFCLKEIFKQNFSVMRLLFSCIFKNVKILMLLLGFGLFASCKTVKPYQKIYLNDSEMQFDNSSNKKFEHYVHSIREGSIPVTGSKSSGGCGCN